MVRNYKDLDVWKKSMRLTNLIYANTKNFSKEEVFGIASQMRRASVSIASNIAEGSVRGSKAEFSRFVGMSRGSLAELETQIMICYEQKYINNETYKQLLELSEDISKMLLRLLHSLKT